MNKNEFQTQTIKLSESEINEQKRYVKKYLDLINKELSYGDLINLENMASYTKSYKFHCNLVQNPYIKMPIIK